MMWLQLAATFAVFAASLLTGYVLGRRHEREAVRETLERIEPSSRTPGQPTNIDAPPARVTQAKGRPGHFMS